MTASRVSLASLVVASCFFMGCFITRDPSYEPPADLPPSVQTVAPGTTPMNRVYSVRSGTTGDDAGVGGSTFFITATVREVNLGQDLEAVVYVNRADILNGNLVSTFDIPAEPDDPTPLERTVPFTVPVGNRGIRPGCNVVELIVSGHFTNTGTVETAEDQDIGYGTWWVYRTDDANPTVDMSDCPTTGAM